MAAEMGDKDGGVVHLRVNRVTAGKHLTLPPRAFERTYPSLRLASGQTQIV